MKILKSIGLLSVLLVVSLVLIACGGNGNNGKIPDPGGKFCYETIIVSLTVSASALDRTWVPADFLPEVVLGEVSVLMTPAPPINRLTLLLTLGNSGRDNVLKAVYALNQRSDVYRANLNIYDTIQYTKKGEL
ncbi:MAG: hypothetical protein FWE16_04490 [Firmicutes bacterium]|nr:hypothetical protein [Bacillota bacterium]